MREAGICQQRVIVLDNQPPTIACSSNIVLATALGQCSRSNVTYTLTSGDNCSRQSFKPPTSQRRDFPQGVTTNRFTVTDLSGNSANCFHGDGH
jgi:hypothetical protein